MLAFIHIPKTGGTTINYILRNSFGENHCDVESWNSRYDPVSSWDLDVLSVLYPKLASIAGHRVVPYQGLDEEYSDIQYFTMVREPLERCASFFQFSQTRTKEELRFAEWIQRDDVQDGQITKIAGERNLDKAKQIIAEKDIFVGLTQYFDESLLLLKYLKAPNLNIQYQRKNIARDNSVKKEILSNPVKRKMVQDVNQMDLKLYKWVKDTLFQRYKHEVKEIDENNSVEHNILQERYNVLKNKLYRNAVYKPFLKLYRYNPSIYFKFVKVISRL